MNKPQALAAISAAVALYGCGDSCTEYSEYNCKQLAEATYNVYVTLPGGRERFAGEAVGLDGCEDIADELSSQEEDRSGWSYICCLKTEESSCAEKHR